ncbi:MAG: hypothetical protein Q4D60_11360, partial [Eubacteriales bacterium]|nr:hypothetical protein [Eubacteriales bacterium]
TAKIEDYIQQKHGGHILAVYGCSPVMAVWSLSKRRAFTTSYDVVYQSHRASACSDSASQGGCPLLQ